MTTKDYEKEMDVEKELGNKTDRVLVKVKSQEKTQAPRQTFTKK